MDRLSRNFRIYKRSRDAEEPNRTPIIQFIDKCSRLAMTLHEVTIKVVKIEGDDVPFVLPEKPKEKDNTQK